MFGLWKINMSLKDVNLKIEYRSLIDNIAEEFYIPLLKEAIFYKRAVGFFSSTSLIEISKGLSGLIANGGKMQLIASPNLSEEDIEAIRKGYKNREKTIKSYLLKELKEPENEYQRNKLNYLANLIESGFLDIKIAVTEKESGLGMYHEKVGIIGDSLGNKVAFSGSMNESSNAFKSNYETIDVFKSWHDDNDISRIKTKEDFFDSIWSNQGQGVLSYEFNDVTDAFIKKYKKSNIDCKSYHDASDSIPLVEKNLTFFKVPTDENFKGFYDYQKDAMDAWIKNQCCGIYDMATGAGKTYTALGSLAKLSQILDENIAVIIVVPYIHLVRQWTEDINKFNVKPIIAYSGGDGRQWREKLYDAVEAYNIGAQKNFCVVTTNATFSTPEFQKDIKRLKRNFCLVVDEAHNMGSARGMLSLPATARYRLALSATIERHGDEIGTQALKKYFGKICIKFSLKDAIDKKFLTPYYYYPIIVHLNEEELDKYKYYTNLIRRALSAKDKDDERIQNLMIRRARIIAGCQEKVDKIIDELRAFKDDHFILVYCGATKYDHKDVSDDEDIRQIVEVTRRIGQDLHMKVRRFTSAETNEQRQEIKEMFANKQIQVITAIKCLDEGVNIPAIHKVFILASSTNPKEYIQRRGRVLRKAPNKEYAEIYDFITLPRPLADMRYCSDEEKRLEMSLIKRELERMDDFSSTAKNPAEIDTIKSKILLVYRPEKDPLLEEFNI